MCEPCGELLDVLQTREVENEDSSSLSKEEVMKLFNYINMWTQRQCLCCFKEYKTLEGFSQLVMELIRLAVSLVQYLRDGLVPAGDECGQVDQHSVLEPSDGVSEEADEGKDPNTESSNGRAHCGTESAEDLQETEKEGPEVSSVKACETSENWDTWSVEERGKLLLSVAKIFQIQFPLYTAYKHNAHATIEDISTTESNFLGAFCDMNDVEVPLHLLRYVCLFCGKNGLALIRECFEHGTPDTLPFPIAHAIISIVSNVKIWLHLPAVMQHIVPFRTFVIRYLCRLSDQDLRHSAARNMADLMWSAGKEPLDSTIGFDRESLDLAYKYFTSSTLTMRLAGLNQITNQLHSFNEVCNNESLVSDAETTIAKELADWLINHNIVEHIFGPNLHIEILKQCQVILNFLAAESRLSTQHIDCIWLAAQLKHCSRYIHDLFPSLIKHLDPIPLRHLLSLASSLHPSAHSEQTLYLASMLIKALWNNALATKSQLSKQSSFASLLNSGPPLGPKKGLEPPQIRVK